MDLPAPAIPTSYSQFGLRAVLHTFGIQARNGEVVTAPRPCAPSDWLVETLRRTQPSAFGSEKARSECIIAPILIEARDSLGVPAAIYSGLRFDVDPARGLRGYCDFIIGLADAFPVIQSPLLALVEVKEDSIDSGLGQCAAEMVAAEIFNRQEGNPLPAVFGCVTNGNDWRFLRLQDDLLTVDPRVRFLIELPEILGTFKAMADEATAGVKPQT